MTRITLILLLCLAPSPALAQAPGEPLWRSGAPEEMSRLDSLPGDYDVRLFLPGRRAPIDVTTRVTISRELGGAALLFRGPHPFTPAPVDVIVLLAYDRFNRVYRLSAADAMTGQLDIFEGDWEGERLVLTNLRVSTFVTDQSSGQRFHSRLVIVPGEPLTMESAFSPDEGTTWFPPSRQEFVRRQ
jgi:hypothetical protein